MTEDQLQAKCFQWIWNTYPNLRRLCWHVPNGGHRNKFEAAKFKSIGVVAGVADLEFHFKGRSYFIELKIPGGVQSLKQKKVQEALEGQGFNYYLIWSFEEFKQTIERIITTKTQIQ